MTARFTTRIAATALLAGTALTVGTAAASAGTPDPSAATTASSSDALPPADIRNATAFVTPDGKVACAYDRRDSTTKCVNTTAGWKAYATPEELRDTNGNTIADAPFVTTVTRKDGPASPTVSTQAPMFDSASDQGWRDPNAIATVHVWTSGYGDYVDQKFAVTKPGQVLGFPDGVTFFVDSENHLRGETAPGDAPWVISTDMVGQHD